MVKIIVNGYELYFGLNENEHESVTEIEFTDKRQFLSVLLDVLYKEKYSNYVITKDMFHKSEIKKRILEYLLHDSYGYSSFVRFIDPIYADTIFIISNRYLSTSQIDNAFTPRSSGRYPWREWIDSIKWEENTIMPYKKTNNVEITKIVTHNNMVTIVYFSDGTFTKAICSKNDTYDLDVGIQVCLMKKMLGDKRYFKTMEYAHKLIEKQEQDKKDAIELKRKRRDEQKRREEKNRKLVQEAHDKWKSDITDAMKEAFSSINKEDDLK